MLETRTVFGQRLSSARIATLASGAGQLFAFACVPLLSRLYTPEDFGGYVAFSAFYNTLNIALTGRYDQALQYAKSAREASQVLVLALSVAACTTAVALALAGVWSLFGNGSDAPSMLFWATLSAAAAGCTRIVSFMFVRWRRYGAFAWMNFVRPAALSSVQLLLGIIGPGPRTLALGHALASGVTLCVVFLQERKIRAFVRRESTAELRKQAHTHRAFPMYTLPQNLVFVLSDAAVPLLAAHHFGAATAGLYWFAARMTTAPMQVLVESIRPLINNGLVAALRRQENMAGWSLRTAVKLALPFCAGTLLVAVLGRSVFGWVFGQTWTDAAPIAAILFGYAAVNAAGVPFIAALPMVHMQRLHLLVEVLVLLAKALGFYTFAGTGPLACIAASTVAAVLGYVGLYGVVYWTMRRTGGAAAGVLA